MASPDFELWAKTCEHPAELFRQFYRNLTSPGALDEKTKQLIYIAVLTTTGYGPGVKSHVQRAIRLDASVEEIREAMLLAIPAAGLPPFLKVYAVVYQLLEQVEGAARCSPEC